MAAYAALVSVMHIIDDLQLHCRPPISLHKQQVLHLTEKFTFFQQFLEVYNPNLEYSKEADPLESRIAAAAYAAEDAIESDIYDHLTNNNGEKSSPGGLYEALEKVIEDMALIEKEAMEIKKEIGGFQNHAKPTPPADFSGSYSSSSVAQKKSTVVGAGDLLLELKTKLVADARDLQTLPIVGMGGSGKTTLALNIYEDGLITERFDIRAWITISQEYSIREILIQFLTQLIEKPDQRLSDGELGEMLHKHLYDRRFIVILDDMWSIKAWDGVKRFLPNNKNGSRIVITTRLTDLASTLPNSNSLRMKLLGEDDSWDLLSKTVFGEIGVCPLELEKIGKKIGKSCKGLPLSIVVVGGLLAKSRRTIEYWEYMEKNLNAIVNLDDGERCLRTLYMSYKQLPVHLKACFLYMGIYREDYEIRISDLIKLWVAEGFLKPVSGKRLEEVARAYLKDLIDRNLIMIHKLGKIGSMKYCKVHDLLRDLCLREAEKEGFYGVYRGQKIDDSVSRVIMSSTIQEIEEIDALSSPPLARSFILDLNYFEDVPPHFFKPLRIVSLDTHFDKLLDNMHQLVNSRYFNFTYDTTNLNIPSLIWLYWNLKTLHVKDIGKYTAPTDIWYMSNIRHLYFDDLCLPDPPNVQDDIILANLQSLGCIRNFTCSEQVVKRIPNIRKLNIFYDYHVQVDERFCLANLDCLDKLKSLIFNVNGSMMCRINYPRSLMKLWIGLKPSQRWQDILDKIGALPLLRKLQLNGGSFEGRWKTKDGLFRGLKLLSLIFCRDIQVWESEASHFPILENLYLYYVSNDLEIPSDFAEIPTLRLIDVDECGDSTVKSAKRILEEQEELYGEEETTLRVQVKLSRYNDPELESLSSSNFHVTPNDE